MRRSLTISGLVLMDLMAAASAASAQSVTPTRLPEIEIEAPYRRPDKNIKRKPVAVHARGTHRAVSRNPGPANTDAARPNAEGAAASAPAAAASETTVSGAEVTARPLARPAEALEVVPGLIVTQHSGEGKANQYFLRGYNLDHGTDLAITVDDMPVNMRTHAHGQGYADLNWLMPETINTLAIRKGPYFADEGDFASAGNLHIGLIDRPEKNIAQATLGSFGYQRYFGMGATALGNGTLLAAGEVGAYNGPWTNPDDMRKLNGLLRYTQGTATDGLSVTGMAYSNKWNSTDQVPQRAITSGLLDRFGTEDPSDGGNTNRFSLSARMAQTDALGSWKANAYIIKSELDLFNNFTYFLSNPDLGDQFHQHDNRLVVGGSISRTFVGSMGGRPTETTIGVQTRYDDIQVGLTDTFQRAFLSNVRSDKVREGSVGIYLQNATRWAAWLR